MRSVCERLGHLTRLAVDTESASFHRYRDRVYLVQISSAEETFLIDPIAVPDLTPVGHLLSSPDIEVTFHDADYDLRTLDRDYGFRATRLFDTRVAAQLAGEPGVGLGSLLERHFKVRLNKKLQRADWSRRPLTAEMLTYAADDTRYLLDLRDVLEGKLAELGRLPWAKEEFRLLEQIRWNAPDNTDPHLRIKRSKTLSLRQQAVLAELFAWRDTVAADLDRAPFRVLTNDALLELAGRPPENVAALEGVRGVTPRIVERWGTELVAAVTRGLAIPDAQLRSVRRTKRPPPDAVYDARLERLKNLRTKRASELGLDPGLVCPNGTLQAIARAADDEAFDFDAVSELRAWQQEILGKSAMLAALAGP